MGRIVATVEIKNVSNPDYRITCDALVDTGASYMVLPTAWKSKLGNIEIIDEIEVELANQTAQKGEGEICGPVKLQIEGFSPMYTEVLFIDMRPANGIYEPLIGYIVLEQCQAGGRYARTQACAYKKNGFEIIVEIGLSCLYNLKKQR